MCAFRFMQTKRFHPKQMTLVSGPPLYYHITLLNVLDMLTMLFILLLLFFFTIYILIGIEKHNLYVSARYKYLGVLILKYIFPQLFASLSCLWLPFLLIKKYLADIIRIFKFSLTELQSNN